MIVFDLTCNCGLTFEAWFQDRKDFICQQEDGLLVCPNCGGNEVRKILSAVSMQRGTQAHREIALPANGENITEETAVKALGILQDYVKKNFEDVGSCLAEESLKIHYGVKKPRNIRGVASDEEEKVLEKEGVQLLKIPMPPEDDEVN